MGTLKRGAREKAASAFAEAASSLSKNLFFDKLSKFFEQRKGMKMFEKLDD